MSLLEQLSRPDCWERFYTYKMSADFRNIDAKALRAYIDGQQYLPVCAAIAEGKPFPLPKKSVISKMSSSKRRTVYTYPAAESTVLKLLTYLMLRRYDRLFSTGLYSFRPGRNAKDAFRRLAHAPGIAEKYAYKVDISNYFNSVPVARLLPMLEETLCDDPQLYAFLARLLEEPQVLENGRPVCEEKGIMAGTPLSSFYANLYLAALDRSFAERNVLYVRYSDDIIVFGETAEQVQGYADEIRSFLAEMQLTVNPSKECFFAPEDGFVFLGFYARGGSVDIAPASLKKLKAKMRRKAKALMRWRQRLELPGEKATAAFIRIFNRKLFEHAGEHELTWTRWFFPVINTADSLHEIDLCAQDCLRWLISGTRTKSRYNVRYADLKALGYQSLVNRFYAGTDDPDKAEAH